MFSSRGFGPLWRKWIRSTGCLCVRINNVDSAYLVAGKGLEQGDPLSLILFNLITNFFFKMLEKATSAHLIRGLLPQVVPRGAISLQYADDKTLSGIKINYNKCDLMTVNMDESQAGQYAQIFCCKLGTFPFKYYRISLHHSKLLKEDLQHVVDKIMNRANGWKGKIISHGGNLVLPKTCLSSIPTYLCLSLSSLNGQLKPSIVK